MTPADSSIAARSAMETIPDGNGPTVSKHRRSRGLDDHQDGKRLRYMQFVVGKSEVGRTPSATYTEVASPVPGVPTSDYQYQDITRTLSKYPHLFKIVTPIHADRLEMLLYNHPNQLLVRSICSGLRHGFWPFADTMDPECQPFGVVVHQSGMPSLDEESAAFLLQQWDREIKLAQYSEGFGPDLLPGMTAQPIFTTPKKGSVKLQLVNTHSAGMISLTSLILVEGVFVKLDPLSDFVSNTRATLAENGGRHPVYLWKLDASQAYRCLPMHPRWQVRQATLVDRNYHVDRCAVFGN